MKTTDKTVTIRVSALEFEALQRAAEAVGGATPDFVKRAVLRVAATTLGSVDHTPMPTDLFESVTATLDAPDDAPRLRRAFVNHVAQRVK